MIFSCGCEHDSQGYRLISCSHHANQPPYITRDQLTWRFQEHVLSLLSQIAHEIKILRLRVDTFGQRTKKNT